MAGVQFIEKGDPGEFFVIVGKAGTGKTSISEIILRNFKNKKILVCALSHKAKLVIAEKITKAIGSGNVISKSVAGALAMKMDNETGKFIIAHDQESPPIREAEIIICDECSMINEESHQLIMSWKKKRAKVIYLGDVRQLPPIRERDSPYANKPSPVFYGKNIAILTERIRQGENSPILPFADFYGDNSRIAHPLLNPAPGNTRKNIVNDNGALVFASGIFEIIDQVMPLYEYCVKTGRHDVIKTVSYRNNIRTSVNIAVRDALWGEKSCQQIVEGDLLMFQDNYNIDGFDEPISNSYEVQATATGQSIHEKYKIWEVEFIYETKPVTVKVLDHSEVKIHAADVKALFEIAKRLPWGTTERSDALADAWGLKNRYAPLDYAYAITSHKSQGSTYNTVIVDERDIMSVSMIDNKEKSQSMYTAITRASTCCIVLDGQKIDCTLQQAISLAQTKL